jgi:manganese-dependent inorganic pyrophosphatase
MFEASSDVGDVPAAEIIRRDVKEYEVRPGKTVSIAQIETVGQVLIGRRAELLQEMEAARGRRGDAVYALMVTDIVEKGTDLLVAGDRAALERAFDAEAVDGVIDLPGVMSRKKQVVPAVLSAF